MGLESVDPNIWKHQKPFEVVDPKALSVTKLENYFLVLLAMEENTNEYLRLKQDLIQIYEEICVFNAKEEEQQNDDLMHDEREEDESDEDEEGAGAGGDVMSALITGNVVNKKQMDKMIGEKEDSPLSEDPLAAKLRRQSTTKEVVERKRNNSVGAAIMRRNSTNTSETPSGSDHDDIIQSHIKKKFSNVSSSTPKATSNPAHNRRSGFF